MSNPLTKLAVAILVLVLPGCATMDEPKPDLYEILSLGKMPEGDELKDECACLKEKINRVNEFSDRFKHSRYAVYYHALGREKIEAFQNRADDIACKYPVAQAND